MSAFVPAKPVRLIEPNLVLPRRNRRPSFRPPNLVLRERENVTFRLVTFLRLPNPRDMRRELLRERLALRDARFRLI